MTGSAAFAPAALAEALERARAHAPFLARLADRTPYILDRFAQDGFAAVLARAAAESLAERDVGVALRRERATVALTVALADLAGVPLEIVTAALTDFADRALDRAIAAVIEARSPGAGTTGFAALALGKQGSRELNYSSDIDPILLFDPRTLPHRAREEPEEAAARIARGVVNLLQERTAEGYVLRVDLRLRPAAEATPPAVPIDLAIVHYESSALPWERAAFIRARAAAGDRMLGQSLLDAIRPFVWRRALDYGAIREMRALSHRIRNGARAPLGPGFDLKRGRGGIREVEFFTQIHQLIHGGRNPRLRAPATLEALNALAEAGVVPAADAAALADAYRLLRTIEHRLQMVDDHQTHLLPVERSALDNVARLAGLADGAALVDRLRPTVETVGRLYDALEETLDDAFGGGSSPPDLVGFADPRKARARIDAWRAGTPRTTRSQAAREALERVLPALVAALGGVPAPDAALDRLDGLVARLPSALNLFRLLEARPGLIEQLVTVLAHAPALADALGRRASLLDGLVDASALEPPPEVLALAADLARGERNEDYQATLDRVRVEVGERRFRLGVGLVTGRLDPIAAGEGYARLAEAAVEVLAGAAVAEFARAHGCVPDSELVILALGRLGGGVMTDASDLDLVYLFTGDFLATSDGVRPLGATTYYNRLSQRVTAALSVPTPSGPLYPIDTRLRPSGNQGLLAVSLDSFARYEDESAWTWEHMALTRARPVFGSARAREAARAVIAATLGRSRDPARLVADAGEMRVRIAANKPPTGPLDVKLIEGGLVDAEFTVHLLQLRHGIGLTPRLRDAACALEREGLLRMGFGAAGALLTRMLITLRLVAPGGAEPAEASREVVARACGRPDWAAQMVAYAEARALVAAEWHRVSGGLSRAG